MIVTADFVIQPDVLMEMIVHSCNESGRPLPRTLYDFRHEAAQAVRRQFEYGADRAFDTLEGHRQMRDLLERSARKGGWIK